MMFDSNFSQVKIGLLNLYLKSKVPRFDRFVILQHTYKLLFNHFIPNHNVFELMSEKSRSR